MLIPRHFVDTNDRMWVLREYRKPDESGFEMPVYECTNDLPELVKSDVETYGTYEPKKPH